MSTTSEKNSVGIIKTWNRFDKGIYSFIIRDSTGYYFCFGSPSAHSNECIRFKKLKDAMNKAEESYLQYAKSYAMHPPGVR